MRDDFLGPLQTTALSDSLKSEPTDITFTSLWGDLHGREVGTQHGHYQITRHYQVWTGVGKEVIRARGRERTCRKKLLVRVGLHTALYPEASEYAEYSYLE